MAYWGRGDLLEFLAIKPCKADAFEVVPKGRVTLDLAECETLLREGGYEILSSPGVMLVVRKEVELTLYPHGRILMHPISTKEEAHRHASDLYSAVGM
jgi:ArsR family metal-binding transcriptional regulator